MEFIPIKTRPMLPPRDDLFEVLDTSLPPLAEGDIVLVTSKVLAIHQGRCIPMRGAPDKDGLTRVEAEQYLERNPEARYPVMLTIKHHTLIASAGIDESNGNGHYILWPERIQATARELWQHLRHTHGIEKLGVIVTDSHALPLRRGVLGVAIGFWGFEPMIDVRGKPDIFGRPLTMTRQNVPDAVAAFGVFCMGESNETTPLLIARGLPLWFTSEDRSEQFWVEQKDDMFGELLAVFKSKTNQ